MVVNVRAVRAERVNKSSPHSTLHPFQVTTVCFDCFPIVAGEQLDPILSELSTPTNGRFLRLLLFNKRAQIRPHPLCHVVDALNLFN